MLLRRHLVDLESGVTDLEISKKIAAPSDLIGTAQAAQMSGHSRRYVATLIDQHQLKGASISAGRHRRVSRATALEWKEQHPASSKDADLRTQGQKIGACWSPEAQLVRRVKALAAQKE